MENHPVAAATHEEACERVASLFRSRWLRHYVAGKLRSDPVFPAVFESLRGRTQPLLDVGCGVGLLALYLRGRGWLESIIGIDTDARKIEQARRVEASLSPGLEFFQQDVRDGLPAFQGNIAALDLLHYLEPAQQTALLDALAERLAPGCVLLLRDSPSDDSLRHRITHLGEIFAQTISWNLNTPLHFPTRESINRAFSLDEFDRVELPVWGRTPFNNRLFIFTKNARGVSECPRTFTSAAAPAAE